MLYSRIRFYRKTRYLIDTLFNPSRNAVFHGICPDCGLDLGTLERSSNSINCNLRSIDIDVKNSTYDDFLYILTFLRKFLGRLGLTAIIVIMLRRKELMIKMYLKTFIMLFFIKRF